MTSTLATGTATFECNPNGILSRPSQVIYFGLKHDRQLNKHNLEPSCKLCLNTNAVAPRSIIANLFANDRKGGSIAYLQDCSQSIKIDK
jgi:hypothetical protein